MACVVATLQEKVLDLDDVVTVFEKEIEEHQGNFQALHDCNATLRDKLEGAIKEHQELQDRVLELEQARARQEEVWRAENQQLQDRMLDLESALRDRGWSQWSPDTPPAWWSEQASW